jgi:hypothetical protein
MKTALQPLNSSWGIILFHKPITGVLIWPLKLGAPSPVRSVPLTLEMLHGQIMDLQLRLEKAEADLEQMRAIFLTHTHNYNVPSLSFASTAPTTPPNY